jgi:hypothetical protein
MADANMTTTGTMTGTVATMTATTKEITTTTASRVTSKDLWAGRIPVTEVDAQGEKRAGKVSEVSSN